MKIDKREFVLAAIGIGLIWGITPIIYPADVGQLYLINQYGNVADTANCVAQLNPTKCQDDINNGWILLQIWPFYFMIYVIGAIMYFSGIIQAIVRRKKCPQCSEGKCFVFQAKNKERYYDCKKCGVFPETH